MREFDAMVYNQNFIDRSNQGDLQKIAQLSNEPMRQRVWEEGFARKVLSPIDVTRSDPGIQEDTQTDTIYFLDRMEVLGYAVALNIRGNSNANVFYQKKYPISFFKIETQRFSTDEYTIKASPYPITRDLEQKLPLFIQTVEDRELTINVEAMCQLVQQWGNGGIQLKFSSAEIDAGNVTEVGVFKSVTARADITGSFALYGIEKADITTLVSAFPGRRGESLVADKILITDTDFASVNNWDATTVGFELAGQTTVGEYKAKTIEGKEYIRTNKTSILRPGNVYAFAGAPYLGKFLRFIDFTLYMDKRGDRYEFWGSEVIGMGFPNIFSMKKLELYSGSQSPGVGNQDAGYEIVQPLSEDQVIKENALVDQGYYIPLVQF